MNRFARLALLITIAGTQSLALADIVYLKDGTKLEGDVKHSDDGWTVRSKGTVVKVQPDQVQSIELTPTTGPAAGAVATERLASLRRSVENESDLKQIIARYQRFIDQNADQTAGADAKKDLLVWQDRSDRNMVKVGSRWILAADRAKLVGEAADLADRARQLLKQGRNKDADPLLVQATEDDPTNPAAQYLLSLLRYQQDQIPAARKALDAANTNLADHAPTLNNLAVVQWRQRQFVAALASFDAAMLAAPVNKEILDNVASALSAMPEEFRNSTVTQKTTRHFQEQDKSLSEQMAQLGWHRYGTTWVTDKEMDQIKEQEKETQDKLDALAADFDKDKEHLDQIDQNIADTESAMHRIEATTFARDPNTGTFLQLPYPATYYDLQRDDQRFQVDRQRELAKMDSIKQSAQALQKKLPGQKSDDVLRMFGPEGTPLKVVDAPPAPAPAAPPAPVTQPDHP